MHDPMTVAFDIPRPWPERSSLSATGRKDGVRWRIRLHHTHVSGCENDPPHKDGAFPWWKLRSYSKFWRLAGREFYWPPLVTVWHNEPGGRDSGSVCKHYRRITGPDGATTTKVTGAWRWHVHHWRIQVPPLQALRRRLLTRCEWCGGHSRKGDVVNHSQEWHRKSGPWWRGESGLFHSECSSVSSAHRLCYCDEPMLEGRDYGTCQRCDKFRPWGRVPSDAERMMSTLAKGQRLTAEMRPHLERLWAEARKEGEE